MRRLLTLCFIFFAFFVFSQAPQIINYQAVARDAAGNVVTTPIGIKFQIFQGSVSGTLVYEETHTATPSSAGVFTVGIGAGTPVTGLFSSINWGTNTYFLQVNIDPAGGTSYNTVGANQLVSVPYALYAEKAGNAVSYNAGNGIAINSGSIVNTAPNQTVNISGSGVLGSYPNYTISSSSLTGGTGISVGSGTITNTSPDQTVNITSAGIATVASAYPNFSVNVAPPSLTYNTGTKELTINQGGASSTATLSGTGSNTISITGTGIAGVTPSGSGSNFTVNVAPPVIIGQGATTVFGSWPNFTVTSSNTTYSPGTGISLTGNVITNTAPNQTVNINGSGSTTVSGSYPNYTISSAGTNYTAGTGISLTGNTITNTAPNQTVNLTASGSATVTGSYPNFNIATPIPTIAAPPILIGTGITTVATAGTNYTINTPPVGMNFTPATGILTYSPAPGINSLNISPGLTFTNNVLSVGSNTISLPGTGLWSRTSTTATTLFNTGDNVGIGTTNPLQKLDVIGYIREGAGSTSADEGWLLYTPSPGLSILRAGGRATTDMRLDQSNNAPMTFWTNGSEKMRILSSGNVGIGTNAPGAAVEISSPSFNVLNLRTSGANSNVNVDAFPTGVGTLQFRTNTANGITFGTNNTLRMIIDPNGLVGIGNTAPTSMLDVVNAVSTGQTAIFTNSVSSGISGSSAVFNNSGLRSLGHSGVIINNITTKSGGSNSTKVGLEVISTGSWGPATVNQPNVGIKVTASGADNNFALQLIDGSQGAGKVLTSDANGNASWQLNGPPKVAFFAGNHATTGQTLPASTSQTIVLTAGPRFFNDGNGFVTASGVFTAPMNGVYQFNCEMQYTSSAGAVVQFIFQSAGNTFGQWIQYAGANGQGHASFNYTLKLSAGESVSIVGFSSASMTIDRWHSSFSGHLIYPY